MNRKKKLIVTGILAIVCIIIAINFHNIKFAFSLFELYSDEKKVESIVGSEDNGDSPVLVNPLEIILEEEEGVVGDVADVDEGNKDDKDDHSVEHPSKSTNNSAKAYDHSVEHPAKSTNDSAKAYKEIISDYNIELKNLRSDFEKELGNLISDGINEYSKDDLSVNQLASKYLFSGAKLEKESDSRFNAIVKDMEQELKANGHDTLIINQVKKYYHDFKNNKKTDLINRGMKRK